MSVIYGNIGNISQPTRTDYFGNVSDSLSAMMQDVKTLNQEKKEARIEAAKRIPLQNPTKVWAEDLGILEEMDKQLRDGLEEASKSPESMAAWETSLKERINFAEAAEENYKATAPKAIENQMRAEEPTMNPFADDLKIDSNTKEYYSNEIEKHDTKGNYKGQVQMTPGGGFSMSTGESVFDHLDVSWSTPKLKDMAPRNPDGWWSDTFGMGETDFTYDEAVNYVKGKIEGDKSGRELANAIGWYVGKNGGNRKDIDPANAILAYAKEAAKGRIKAKEKKSTLEKNQGAKLESLIDGIKKNLGLRLPSIPAPDDIGTFSEGSVPASYAALTGKKIYVGGNFDEDAVEGDEGKKYEVSGVYLTDEGVPVFQLRTSKGDTTVESGFDEDLYKQIESQMDAEYGQGSLLKLLQKM